MVRFVYGIIPVPVFYVDDLDWAAGRAYGIFVRIKKGYEDDEGLIEHELQHIRQFYRLPLIHFALYKFSAWYRYNAELECYKIQLSYCTHYETCVNHFAEFLTTRYGLKLEITQVIQDLKLKRTWI